MSTYPNYHDGRRALVTGAASGIGREAAIKLAQAGAHVLAVDINADGLESLAAEVEGIEAIPCDLSDYDAIAELPKDVDILVNVAGILHFEDLRRTELADWDRIIAVNLTGTFLVCRAVMDHLLATGGNIVNTSSTSALAGHPWTVSYSASKGGVYALTQCLAVEFGKQGVRCNSVAPGSILTPIQNEFRLPDGADVKLINRITALDEHRGPETVASAIAFLASDDAAHVNGTCLKVDGGTLA